ncbi:MAG: Nif3-like dinuclear metal center hexameric protein [Clostridium sp.]|nr:Nif3-like dinuclear metal center hexameric protein [Clostridium sp.]
MLLSDIIKLIEDFAPKYIKEDFDNVGLMVGDKNREVSKILLALDCTNEVIEEAKINDIDLIITHHPLIFRKPSSITTDTLQGSKIMELIKNDIALYSVHTNLDSAENGMNETIAKLLGLKESKLIEVNLKNNKAGIGRVGLLEEEVSIESYAKKVISELGIKHARLVKGNESAKRIAVINGSGQDFISKAVAMGADTIVTGDTTYHFASDYKEMGINIIDIGHFGSEWTVFLKVMQRLYKDFKQVEIIESKKCEDPYIFI